MTLTQHQKSENTQPKTAGKPGNTTTLY